MILHKYVRALLKQTEVLLCGHMGYLQAWDGLLWSHLSQSCPMGLPLHCGRPRHPRLLRGRCQHPLLPLHWSKDTKEQVRTAEALN